MGYADLHIHSTYSHDATTTVRAVLRQAVDAGLNVVAITDHDQIDGALEGLSLAREYGVDVVPGVEVTTLDGHLIALYIEKQPPPGMPLADTLLWIQHNKGLAIAPHPFNNLPYSLSMNAVIGALANPWAKQTLKGIEVYNMSTASVDAVVKKLSVYLPLAKVASSDAHVYWAIGAGKTQFNGITAADLRVALENTSTVAIPYEGELSAKQILSWARRITLRGFGYASDAPHASDPVDTQKFQMPPIKKVKPKQPDS